MDGADEDEDGGGDRDDAPAAPVATSNLPQFATPLVGTIIGNISAFATQVLNYYLGSSQGSARKDMIAAMKL